MAAAANNEELAKEFNLFLLLESFSDGVLDEDEFMALYLQDCEEKNVKVNPSFQYWNYHFNLDEMTDDECNSEFRFKKDDIARLCTSLGMEDTIVTRDRHVVPSNEAVCVLLKRLAYPCRLSDMIPRFGRPVPTLSIIFNHMINLVYERFNHLLSTFEQPWLSRENLTRYAESVYTKCDALKNCWGFIDGTVRECCRPGEFQRVLYNGHHRVHGVKYQSVTCPNGLIANFFGPVEGRRHDSSLLAQSKLLEKLDEYSFDADGNPLCIYGDPAYPLRIHLMTGYKGAALTEEQEEFNQRMSSVRVSVEWIFGDIVRFFAFVDFKKDLKINLSAIGKIYTVCALLQNAHTCLYGNTTSRFFNLQPPELEEYLRLQDPEE